MKKRRSRIIDEAEFREAFGYRQTLSARPTPKTVIKTKAKSEYATAEGGNSGGNNFPSDSASWTSRDEMGSRDELGSSGDLVDDVVGGVGSSVYEDRVETYSSSGVGSESSEVVGNSVGEEVIGGESDLPLEMQLQINRRASRYKPIRIRIPAASHVEIVQAGALNHRVGRRKWQLVWCVVVERLLYVYESTVSDVTLDVINLSNYTPIANLTQPNRSKFKMKIVSREENCSANANGSETHEFYTENSSDFYLWFAALDRIRQQRELSARQTMNRNEIIGSGEEMPRKTFDFLKANEIHMGMSPRSVEKQKIQEKYHQMQVDCVMDVQSKMTRLAQRRNSTSQKISRLNAKSGGSPSSSSSSTIGRRCGLKSELSEIDEEIKQTVFYSKESMSRIAASRERELRKYSENLSPNFCSFEYQEESDDDSYAELVGISLDPAAIDHRATVFKAKKKSNRLSGSRPLKKIQSFARSLSRSKSAVDESKRPTRELLKKELSASSIVSDAKSFDRPKSMIDFPKFESEPPLSSDDTRSSNHGSRPKLSIYHSSFDDDDIMGGAVRGRTTMSSDNCLPSAAKAEANMRFNMASLDESTLDELRRFDEFASAFSKAATVSENAENASAEPPYRENLI